MSTIELHAGQRIAEYVLEERIGRGGFGEVWRARHHAFAERLVALKVPGSPERASLLKREGALQDRVRHPHAVEVIGMDADHDPPYLAMELVQGESLRRRLERVKRLSPEAAVEVALQVLAALDHAHARGVVHRDVKPENVLLDAKGAAKLTDFGLGRVLEEERAKLALSQSLASTDGSDLSGTVAYMAPEQREPGRATDARVDLYAVGILLFEMLTGVRPEGGEAPSDLVSGLDPRLDAVFRRCYCRVDRRYPSAAAVIAELAPLAGPVGLAAVGPLPASSRGTAYLVPLRPPTGSPERIHLDGTPRALDGAAEVRYERGAFWVVAREGRAAVHVVPGQVPAGRRPDEFTERVGAAPLRLSEGMIIRIGDPAVVADVRAYGFHDGAPVVLPVAGTGTGAARGARMPGRITAIVGAVLIFGSTLLLAAVMVGGSGSVPPRFLKVSLPVVVVGLLLIHNGWSRGRKFLTSPRETPLPATAQVVTVSPVRPPSANEPWRDPLGFGEVSVEDARRNPPAGFWLRALAVAMDVAVLGFAAEFLGPRTPLALFLYDWLATALFGATIGKYVCGVRVLKNDGTPPGLLLSLVRTVGKGVSAVLLGLGFVLAGVTPDKRGLHDFLSGTRAVRIRPEE